MKRKLLTTLLTICMVFSFCACGKKQELETSAINMENIATEEEAPSAEKEQEPITYSEYFGQGKTIVYEEIHNSTIGKDTIPNRIYFFEDGQVTKANPDDLGRLTMGEMSKMSDDELWDILYAANLESTSAKFVLTTDSSGNNVVTETIVFLSRDHAGGKICDYMDFVEKSGESQIYDSLYYAYFTGDKFFFIKDNVNLVFDTLDSDNVHIDIKYSDYPSLFSSEIEAAIASMPPMDPLMYEIINNVLIGSLSMDEVFTELSNAGLDEVEFQQRFGLIMTAADDEWSSDEIKDRCVLQGFEPNEMIKLTEIAKNSELTR